MLRLLGLVISIGLADSLNPSTAGPALYLAGGERPRRSVAMFAVGIFIVFLLGGVLLTLGPGRALLALIPHPSHTLGFILETVAGVAMLIASAVLWRQRGRFGRDDDDQEERPKRRAPLLLGATIGIVELPTAFPYFAVVAAVVGSGEALPRQLFLMLIYNVCFVLPLIVILVTLSVAGDRAVEQLGRARAFMRRRWPVVAAVVALLAGVFVTVLGVTGLAGRNHGSVGRFSRHVHRLIPH